MIKKPILSQKEIRTIISRSGLEQQLVTGQALQQLAQALFTRVGTDILSAEARARAHADDEIRRLVGEAPAALDTIYELAQAIQDKGADLAALMQVLEGKANEDHTHVFSDITGTIAANQIAPSTIGSSHMQENSVTSRELDNIPGFTSQQIIEPSIIDQNLSIPTLTVDQQGRIRNHGTHIIELPDGASPSDATPSELGTAHQGTSPLFSRGDHVHQMPNAEQVGARPSNWMPSASDVGARPDNWMPSAQDVGARPNNWNPSASDIATGTLPFAQLPVGTGATQVAQGNHNHDFNNLDGVPSVFPPDTHTHPFTQVTGTATVAQLPVAPVTGGTASQISPGNHTHSAESIDAKPADWLPTIADVQAFSGTIQGQPHTFGTLATELSIRRNNEQADIRTVYHITNQQGVITETHVQSIIGEEVAAQWPIVTETDVIDIIAGLQMT